MTRGGRSRVRRMLPVLVAAIVGFVPFAVAVPAAFAIAGVAVTPTFPTEIPVGANDQAASLQIANNSTPPDNNITISTIALVPSCATTSGTSTGDCPVASADPGVFQLSSTAVGEAGTACAGITFTVAVTDASTGQVHFTPSVGIVLTASGVQNVCRIDFTFNVLKAPTKPAGQSPPGSVLTDQIGFASGMSSVTGAIGSGMGSTSVQVDQVTVHFAVTPAFPAGVRVGQANVAASLQITNTSSVPAGNVTVNDITVVPACATTMFVGAGDCPAASQDSGVFQIGATGIGEPATACAGVTFTTTTAGPSGIVTFTPTSALVLTASTMSAPTCKIDFTFNVLKVPANPAGPPGPHTVLTDQIGFASGTSSFGGVTGSGSGTSSVAVARRTPGDYDGDGKTDVGVFRPATGTWYIDNSGGGAATIVNWGSTGDIPVTGDYDGDGRTDLAVFRPSTGIWYIQLSGGGTKIVNWGSSGDIPVPGDYDGDGKTDIAVFRPSTGIWYIQLSGGGTKIVNWGGEGDVPVPGDYDGTGVTDIAVFRPTTGIWYIAGASGTKVVNWGASGDIPTPGDFDGDGKTDIAVFRPTTGIWYVDASTLGTQIVNWGISGDIPVAGDYNGDGKTDIAVFRPSTGIWYIHLSGTGGTTALNWGATGDVPTGQPASLATGSTQPAGART